MPRVTGDFELLIADDGSADETARLLARYAEEGLPIRHIWQRDDGFRKCRILNKAIVAAGADYLVFSDGDCIPRSDFLAAHSAQARKGRFLSGGYVKLPMGASRAITRDDVEAGRAFSVRWIWHHGGRNVRRTVKLAVPSFVAAAADRVATTRANWNGHNASGWRDDIVAANGFDERMGYYRQDREFGDRLENAGLRGYQIRYRALCVHLDHDHPYRTVESVRRNKSIRRRTRSQRITWTPFGIEKRGTAPEVSPDPAPPG